MVARKYTVNEVASEVMTFKLSNNKSMRDCLQASANAIFSLILKNLSDPDTDKKPLEIIKDTVTQWNSLIQKFIKDKEDLLLLIRCLFVDSVSYQGQM